MNRPIPTGSKTILVAGIDTVRHKNLHQFKCMAQHGYHFIVLTTDNLGDSATVLGETNNVQLIVTRYGFKGVLFLLSLLRILCTTRIGIAEVYPYSFTTMLATALIKLFGIPTAIVARGEEYYYLIGKMSRAMMFAFRNTYMLADHVIYKELYATDFFNAVGMRSRFLLSNAVAVPLESRQHAPRNCSFLFINSLKPFRHPETPLLAFLEICRERSLDESSGIDMRIVGFQGDNAPPDIVDREREIRELMKSAPEGAPVKLLPWSNDAQAHIRQSDVFLLPADVVFLNYSLIEAMAYGLVPLIQDSPSAERILDHGREGYILANTVGAWKEAMETMLDQFETRRNMAELARRKVENRFSLAAYEENYLNIYQTILSLR